MVLTPTHLDHTHTHTLNANDNINNNNNRNMKKHIVIKLTDSDVMMLLIKRTRKH